MSERNETQFNKDLEQGNKAENELLPLFKEKFDKNLKQTSYKYDVVDFESKNTVLELKTRNYKFKNLPDLKLSAKKLRSAELFTWLCLALCTAQILFGTALRESVDQQAAFWNQTNRGSWVTLSGEVFNIHKGFSFLLTLATIICSGYILEHFKEIKRLISYVIVIITIMALQIITGIVLAYFNLPPAMQTLHLFFASLLIGAWVLQLALLANYRKSISMAIII
jgi:hypothetical protein